MKNLIATSPTENGLLKLAKQFFLSENIRIEGEKVFNAKGEITSCKVVKKKGRYRLEFI